jgi:hypothetical protein
MAGVTGVLAEASRDGRSRAMIPLVLAGPPRSGTTMLSALIDGHSEINWLPDEGFFFEHLHVLGAENFERFLGAAALGVDALIEGLRDRSLMPPTHRPLSDFPALRYEWSEPRFRQALTGPAPATVQALWAVLRDAYLAALGQTPRRYVSIKAADYGRSVFGALDHFADARGLVVVRHPIPMLNSLKAYRAKRNAKLITWPTLVEAVVAMNRLAEGVDRYPKQRLALLRYEDVAADPEGQMRALCDWLAVGFEAAMTTPTMMGQAWSNNSSFGAGESGTAPLPEQRAEMLSAKQREYILDATRPFRARFGYDEKGAAAA